MVEHAWVRIAELKEDAAFEEWEAANPRLARLRKSVRWLRIRWLNWLKDFRESERGQRWEGELQLQRLTWLARALHSYLVITRWGGCRPSRQRVLRLSTRALIEELDLRGIGRGDCVERSELIDALCGQASADDEADEGGDLVPPSPVDKMV